MKWLTASEAEKLLRGYRGIEPQTFILPCDVEDLTPILPARPRHISTEEGVASPTDEWVGMVSDRPVVVQQELIHPRDEMYSVTVLTPYPEADRGKEGWAALRELQEIPRPIRPSRPLYIQSLTTSNDHVVCRPNPLGWDDVIYHAASHSEAESLVDYLHGVDRWNESCFIGKVENPGEWTIFSRQGRKDRILGAYPDVTSALRVASTLSNRSPDDVLVVKDVLEKRKSKEYLVARGRVMQATA